MSHDLIRVEDLGIHFQTERGSLKAVDGISFGVRAGETLAIVGESGCGKSVTSLAIMGLLPELGDVSQGSIVFQSQDLTKVSKEQMRQYRGNQIAMIFQEPMTALNPVYTVGQQIMEVYRIHRRWPKSRSYQEAVSMLEKVRIPDPHRRMDEYPFQMSGGMRQRVLIAMALACRPKLLIADEPTTALDVTIQSQILRLIKELQSELGTAVIFITHDLGVVAEIADRVAVMYAGRIIESGTVYEIFDRPSHPYTRGLLAAIPRLDGDRHSRLSTIEGSVPSLHSLPSGCRFRNRCSFAIDQCSSAVPALDAMDSKMPHDHRVACHRWQEVS